MVKMDGSLHSPERTKQFSANTIGPGQAQTAAEKGPSRLPVDPGTVEGVLLLAGCSSRMGSSKPLLPFGDQTLVSLMLSRILKSDLTRVIVVLGFQAKAVRKEILRASPSSRIKIVINPEFEKGQSSSIISALSHLDPELSGVMFLVGDQPLLTTEVINKLLTIFRRTSAPIVVPLYGERPGNPVIFRNTLIPELRTLSGDMGGRELIKKYWNQVQRVSIRPLRIGRDMDTREHYEKLKEFVL
jgi:molybdenum cofactor cytidylyltransferase